MLFTLLFRSERRVQIEHAFGKAQVDTFGGSVDADDVFLRERDQELLGVLLDLQQRSFTGTGENIGDGTQLAKFWFRLAPAEGSRGHTFSRGQTREDAATDEIRNVHGAYFQWRSLCRRDLNLAADKGFGVGD